MKFGKHSTAGLTKNYQRRQGNSLKVKLGSITTLGFFKNV